MSDLFWIIPLIISGITTVCVFGIWVVHVFKVYDWRDILLTIIIFANVLSLLSLGLWLAIQSSFVTQTIGLLILLVVVYGLVSIWAMSD